MNGLKIVYFLRNFDDSFHTLGKILREIRYCIRLFLKDKGREECYDFSWFISRKNVVKDEFCEDEFIGRVDLVDKIR